VNYPALKGGASNFNGTSKHRGLASLALADSASVSSGVVIRLQLVIALRRFQI